MLALTAQQKGASFTHQEFKGNGSHVVTRSSWIPNPTTELGSSRQCANQGSQVDARRIILLSTRTNWETSTQGENHISGYKFIISSMDLVPTSDA